MQELDPLEIEQYFLESEENSPQHALSAKRQFKGIWVEKSVFMHPDLHSTDKLFLSEIIALDQPDKGCFASNSYFAFTFRISETQVSNIISKLKKMDIIHQESFDGKIRVLKVNKGGLLAGYIRRLHEDLKIIDENQTLTALKGRVKAELKAELKCSLNIYNSLVNSINNSSILKNTNPSPRLDNQNHSSKENQNTKLPEVKFTRTRQAPKIDFVIKRGTPCYEFVRAWNASPGHTTKHSLGERTQTLKKIKTLYSQLHTGKFFIRRVFNGTWLKNNPKVAAYIREWQKNPPAFTDKELLEAVKAAALYGMDGYWPTDKTKIPRALPDMIYNERANTSWLLKAMVNPPKPLSEDTNGYKEWNPKIIDDIFSLTGEPKNRNLIMKADKCARKLAAAWDATTDIAGNGHISYNDFYSEYKRAEDFVWGYIEWVEEQDWLDSKTVGNCFSPEGGIVQKWFSHLKERYDYGDEGFHIHLK